MRRPTPFGVLVVLTSALSFVTTADMILGLAADRITTHVEVCSFDRIDRIRCPSVTLAVGSTRLLGDTNERFRRSTFVCEWMHRTSLSGLIILNFYHPYTCWVV